MSEDRGQMSEDRGQMSEDKGQRANKAEQWRGEDAEVGIIRCRMGDLRLHYRLSKPHALPFLPATRNPQLETRNS
jgi:hypothetical protein